MPSLWPTEEEEKYATEKIVPVAEQSARNIFEKFKPKFDKTYIDQDLIENWGTAKRMRAHIEELGLSLRRFSVFVGAPGLAITTPHIDGGGLNTGALVGRLNVPLRGYKGSRLNWWDAGPDDPRIIKKHFEEWNAKTEKWQPGYSFLADPNATWEEPDYYIDDAGPCWNRTEKVHKLGLANTTEIRVNVTADLFIPISWETLVERLQALGYC